MTHALQFKSGERATSQTEFATRHIDYRAATYGLSHHPALYLVEVCSARMARDMYEEHIDAAIPEGSNIDEFCLCKGGYTLDQAVRIAGIQGKLKSMFPGCDPRPVHLSEFPSADKETMLSEETMVFGDDFEPRRVKGIKLRGREYTEMIVMNSTDVQMAKNSMDSRARQYTRDQLDSASRRVSDANERVRALEMDKLISDMRLEALVEKNTALQSEVATTRKAALTVMPKEAAAIASTFWGV